MPRICVGGRARFLLSRLSGMSDAWEEGTEPSSSESLPGWWEKSLSLDSDIRGWDKGVFKAQGLKAGKTLQLVSAFELRKIPCGWEM